jgi:senataxin
VLAAAAARRQTASLDVPSSLAVSKATAAPKAAAPTATPAARPAAAALPAALTGLSRPTATRRARSPPRAAAAAARAASAAVAASSEERLKAEATSFALWRRPDAAAFTPAADAYPSGADAYIGTFEPLLFEEAREEVRSEWGAACEAGNVVRLRVAAARAEGGGWHIAQLVPLTDATGVAIGGRNNGLPDARAAPDGGLAVLSAAAPGRDPWRDLKAAAEGGGERRGASACVHVAGLLVRSRGRRDEPPCLYLRFRFPDGPDDPSLLFPPSAALAALAERGRVWHFAPAGRLSTATAEFRALHGVRQLPRRLRDALLAPGHVSAAGGKLPDYDADTPPPLQPQLALPRFMAHLTSSFNDPQRKAIHWAAAAGADMDDDLDDDVDQGGSDAPVGASGAGGSWPFTLVQGPPGTGKTHTVWGMLNVLHLAAYQRYYSELHAAVAPRSAAQAQAAAVAAQRKAAAVAQRALYGDESPLSLSDAEDAALLEGQDARASALDAGLAAAGYERSLAAMARKPRILVCAPSNAAVDVLLSRVMEAEFVQGNGGRYRPDCARVASEDAAMGPRIREVAVGRRVEELMRMPYAERRGWHAKHAATARSLAWRMADLRAALERGAAAGAPMDEALASELMDACEQHDRTLVELGRLEAMDAAEREAAGSYRDGDSLLRCRLEASFVNEAELVFTTLASAGRTVFARLSHGFDVVLIDEAAQASEVAALVPLRHGARRVVLVGDPQQLPATVLSAAARGGLFQRSLFERLQACGARSLLLSLQYRMHPAIRSFPSSYFYQGRLLDAPSVQTAPDEPFYSLNPLLAPYAFFDVASGREARRGASASVRNDAEAALAAALYGALRATLPAGAAAGRVGIVTPYRQQKAALRDAFASMLGEAALAEVSIDTVDGFQGQERDVIILSLVRAHAPAAAAAAVAAGDAAATRATLGFVTDVRRMNVALTRAKRALWVLGNAASLRAAPQWAALLDDAAARGCVVPRATAHGLFPTIAPPPPPGQEEEDEGEAARLARRDRTMPFASLDDPGHVRNARLGAAASAISWGGFAQLPQTAVVPAATAMPPAPVAAPVAQFVPPGGAFTSAAAVAPPPPAFVPEGGVFAPAGPRPVPPQLPPVPQFMPPPPPPLLYEEI